MKKITMFSLENCRYCHDALRYVEALYESDERYRKIPFEKINENEHPEIVKNYDYYFVPTFYVDDKYGEMPGII